jgi:hypothetical protein
MPKAVVTPRWFQRWRANAAAPGSDPADLGTAFGLDLSLHDPALAAPPAEPPAAHAQGWVRRLTARRKPLA